MADKEATRQIAEAYVVSSALDFCKSPTAPVGYMIMSYFSTSVTTEQSVQMTKCEAFTMKSRLSTVWGDEPGVGGGVLSGVNLGFCRPKSHSKTIKCKGEWLCRHDTEMEMNCAGPEGPLNVMGCVIYVKCVSMAVANSDGSISGETKPEDPTPEKKAEPPKEPPPKSLWEEIKEMPGEAYEDAKQRIGGAYDSVKQDLKDLKDVITDPKARQEALDNLKEAGSSVLEDPVGAVQDVAEGVKDDLKEKWKDLEKQRNTGNHGAEPGAGLEMGVAVLSTFKNIFKKGPRKMAEGARKRRGGGRDKKKNDGKDDGQNKKEGDEEQKDQKKEQVQKEKQGDDGSTIARTSPGKYKDADYHKDKQNGRKSPKPKNGQKTLDEKSVQVKDTSSQRIGVDSETGEINVFHETGTGTGEYHGHIQDWGKLANDQKAALIRSGQVKPTGKIITGK